MGWDVILSMVYKKAEEFMENIHFYFFEDSEGQKYDDRMVCIRYIISNNLSAAFVLHSLIFKSPMRGR